MTSLLAWMASETPITFEQYLIATLMLPSDQGIGSEVWEATR